MLKARAGDVIVFGLSGTNLEKLRAGQPMLIELADLGLTGRVVIMYGETEEKMREDLIDLCGPDTVYVDKRRPQ